MIPISQDHIKGKKEKAIKMSYRGLFEVECMECFCIVFEIWISWYIFGSGIFYK